MAIDVNTAEGEQNSQEHLNELSKLDRKLTNKNKSLKIADHESDLARKSKQPLSSEEYELVPPDGGWGWLVLAGSTLVNILIPGTIKSFGVLFVEFMEAFNASPATAAWIPALCYFLYSSLGPLSSILSVKYSYRTVTLLGGTSAALGMILSYWTSSVTYLYISYGVLVGTGAGLAFPPTVYIVTSYFVKLRGLANGICISGSSFGSIILPPVLRLLLETYGYRGSVLLMGAITMNVWVAAIFYEPVECHMKKVPKKPKALENIEEEDAGIVLKFEDQHNQTPEPNRLITSAEASNTSIGSQRLKSPELQKLLNGAENGFVRSASAVVVQNCAKNNEDNRIRKISTPVRVPPRNQTFNLEQLSSTPSLYAVPETGFSNNRLNKLNTLRTSKSRITRRSPSTSSFQYISTPYHGSTLSFPPEEFSSRLSLRSVASSSKIASKSNDGEDKKKKDKKKKFFDLSLLKDKVYLVILISNCTNAIGYTNFVILLPAYAISMGYDKNVAAYLLSIVSTLDLVGRIGGSALSDTGLIPKTWYFVGGLFVSGLSLVILPFTSTYIMMSVCCSIFGLASGVYVGITAVIMADMLGTERLTSSYGISLFLNGILQLIGPPLCGLWFEEAGTYSPLFTTLGLTLLGGASLWGFMPFINKQKQDKENKRNIEEGSDGEH